MCTLCVSYMYRAAALAWEVLVAHVVQRAAVAAAADADGVAHLFFPFFQMAGSTK